MKKPAIDRARFVVPSLPRGHHAGELVNYSDGWKGRNSVDNFFVSRDALPDHPAGTVFVLSSRSLDLLAEYGSNDATRRLWCRLADVSFAKELRPAWNWLKTERAIKEKRDAFDRMAVTARKNGYRLVKK